jgi:hypothetical protein
LVKRRPILTADVGKTQPAMATGRYFGTEPPGFVGLTNQIIDTPNIKSSWTEV